MGRIYTSIEDFKLNSKKHYSAVLFLTASIFSQNNSNSSKEKEGKKKIYVKKELPEKALNRKSSLVKLNIQTWDCEDGLRVDGYYQLEPIPKMLIRQKKNLDMVVIMASKESLERKRVVLFPEQQNRRDIISPVGFLIEQTRAYKKEIEGENASIDFLVLKTQNDSIKEIEDAVEAVRVIKSKQGECKFYLDIHGGKREEQENLNGVFNLLRAEGIEFEDIYTTSFNNPVKSVKKSRIYDFTVGINEFIQYGSMKNLRVYFEEEKSKNIVEAVNDISNALSLCDVEKFENALEKFNASIAEEGNMNSYLQLFVTTIKNDYGPLLNKATRNLVTELEWASRKNYIQQCLALVEAKTPMYFYNKIVKRFTLTKKAENEEKAGDNHGQMAAALKNVGFVITNTKENLLKSFLENVKKSTIGHNEKEYFMNILPYVKKNERNCGNIRVEDDRIVISGYKTKGCSDSFDLVLEESDDVMQCEKRKECIEIILEKWQILKEIRNNVMHAKTGERSVEDVTRYIDEYLKAWKALGRMRDDTRGLEKKWNKEENMT